MKNIRRSGLISVIIPCFNAGNYIEEAVQSAINQSYANVELLVVDDGSTDRSREILTSLAADHGDRMTILHQNNKGPYPARNLALRHARGEYIAFLDADDYWRLDCLEKLHSALVSSDAVLAYCGWQNIGLDGPASKPYIPPDYEFESKLESFLSGASPWPIHAALIRRDILETAGGFSEEYPTCMDYDLWLRVAISNPIKRVGEVLAFYRHHSNGQITSKQWRQARNVWLIKKNFIRNFPELVANIPTSKLRKLINKSLLQRGYNAYWRRDLVSAQKIFRMVLRTNSYGVKDLRYLLPALLPSSWYISLIQKIDRYVSKR